MVKMTLIVTVTCMHVVSSPDRYSSTYVLEKSVWGRDYSVYTVPVFAALSSDMDGIRIRVAAQEDVPGIRWLTQVTKLRSCSLNHRYNYTRNLIEPNINPTPPPPPPPPPPQLHAEFEKEPYAVTLTEEGLFK